MGRRPSSDRTVDIRIAGRSCPFAASTIEHLPDAPQFVAALCEKGLSATTALSYARVVAIAKRDGHTDPRTVVRQLPRTALNAYWQWVEGFHERRVIPVIDVMYRLTNAHVRECVASLRVGSLVPPYPGKLIPRKTFNPALCPPLGAPEPFTGQAPRPSLPLPPNVGVEITWHPTAAWTLHCPVSTKSDTPHKDPCLDCVAYELVEEQLQVIAKAFYDAWGPQDIGSMPPECYLFGQPPPASPYSHAARKLGAAGHVVALLDRGPLADDIEQFGGSVTSSVDAFLVRMRERTPDVIVLDRSRVTADVLRVLDEMCRPAAEPTAFRVLREWSLGGEEVVR